MREIILDKIIKNIISKIEKHKGISEFIKNLSKFEGWLKVELVDTLLRFGCLDILPEKDRIDVTFRYKTKNYAIELKTINTNYQKGFKRKTRPIKNNIEGLKKDIISLENKNYDFRYVLFIVFPLDLDFDKKKWTLHLKKINELVKLKDYPIKFEKGYKGRLYLGRI